MVSIVIGYRNRDLTRVKNSLNSLLIQTRVDFELIFVDYGSDTEVHEGVKDLVNSYSFAKYIYSDTRGWFWNRAHALNTGIKIALGDVIIISDIDLVFQPDFLEDINKLNFSHTFYTFSCYYLSHNIDYSKITINNLHEDDVSYVGLCAVLKDDLIRNNCFDEYYMSWGGEDDDLYLRLEGSGCRKQTLGVDTFPVMHQWHQKHSPPLPNAWYLDMVNYLYSGASNEAIKNKEYGSWMKTSARNVLMKMDNNGSFKRFELFPNPLFQFNLFLDGFFKMPAGDFGEFNFPIHPNFKKGRKQKLIEKVNNQLFKFKISYSLQEKIENDIVHDRQTWYNFIMYFIGKNRPFLNDYYLINTDRKLTLFFQKK